MLTMELTKGRDRLEIGNFENDGLELVDIRYTNCDGEVSEQISLDFPTARDFARALLDYCDSQKTPLANSKE